MLAGENVRRSLSTHGSQTDTYYTEVLVEMRDKLRDAMRLYEAMLDRAAEKHQARSSIYQGQSPSK